MQNYIWIAAAVALGLWLLKKAAARIRLSRAKHPSLRGHSKMSRRLVKLLPFYEYDEDEYFCADGAPSDIAQQRRRAFSRLAESSVAESQLTLAASDNLVGKITDVGFVDTYRVPFQFRWKVQQSIRVGCMVDATDGTKVRDLDGNWKHDVSGSYGVNLHGNDFYKECIDKGIERVRDLGAYLGSYHPVIADNVERLRRISGLDEVSFHMSGTEAVMQAVRLARYHTGKNRLVRFCGAYHGWWDGVQPGVGTSRNVHDVYTLTEQSDRTLGVLRTRHDIACVLVNPLQALHPNASAPSDAALVGSGRSAGYDKGAYSAWLRKLRSVCTERGIVLIFDEVFLGFRLAIGGAQEYFGVKADLVTYGKTLGGGLPVGVVCGRRDLMQRYRPNRPGDICFARGTFNSHPYVMASMNEFLKRLDDSDIKQRYNAVDRTWNDRAQCLNQRLADKGLPIKVENMVSVFTTLFLIPSRYNWMFQFYLRDAGLQISWVGSGRFIFSHDHDDNDFSDFADRFVMAAQAMAEGGWWWQAEGLTNKSINRQILRRLLRASFGRRPAKLENEVRPSPPSLDHSAPPSEEAAETCGTSERR